LQLLIVLKKGFFLPFLLLFITSNIFAENKLNGFVISNEDNILNERAIKKINEMGTELNSKTGINVFISIHKSLNGSTIKDFEYKISKGLVKPFVLFTFAKADKQIDIICSESVKDKFDKETVLDDYAIPLIVMKPKRGTNPDAPYAAGLFNGYAEIIDEIAKSKEVEIKSTIGSESKNSTDILRYFIEITTFLVVIVLIYQYVNRKKNG